MLIEHPQTFPDVTHTVACLSIFETRYIPLYCFLFHGTIIFIKPSTKHNVDMWDNFIKLLIHKS
jgi:hypothetical protein